MSKKRVLLFIILTFCTMYCFTVVSADRFTANNTMTETFVSQTLTQNTTIMEEVFGDKARERYDENSFVQIHVSCDKKSVAITLAYKETTSSTVLQGVYDEVVIQNEVGYVGVYEGFISPIENRNLAVDSNGQLPIIADITFTDTDIFAVLTLGYASGNKNPDILFYGNYSMKIADVSNTNAIQALAEVEKENIYKSETATPMSVDTTCKYQGCDDVYFGSQMAGVLSVFHADNIRSGGSMTTYVKVNTKSSLVESYIENGLAYGSNTMAAYPDKFNISISGNDNGLHVATNSYAPQNNTTSSTINIPVYLGPILGSQTVPFSITMSSTTVTASSYSGSSQHPNNKLSWEIYKRNGWNPDTFDGGYTTKTGMSVAATYMYEGNVTTSYTRSMTATGSIRYEYWVMIMGNLSAHHLSTGVMSKTTNVTICP